MWGFIYLQIFIDKYLLILQIGNNLRERREDLKKMKNCQSTGRFTNIFTNIFSWIMVSFSDFQWKFVNSTNV